MICWERYGNKTGGVRDRRKERRVKSELQVSLSKFELFTCGIHIKSSNRYSATMHPGAIGPDPRVSCGTFPSMSRDLILYFQ
jgi:hypothetical protein